MEHRFFGEVAERRAVRRLQHLVLIEARSARPCTRRQEHAHQAQQRCAHVHPGHLGHQDNARTRAPVYRRYFIKLVRVAVGSTYPQAAVPVHILCMMRCDRLALYGQRQCPRPRARKTCSATVLSGPQSDLHLRSGNHVNTRNKCFPNTALLSTNFPEQMQVFEP